MNDLVFDAVLCDLDGVLRLWDPDGMTALDRAWGLPEGTLAAAAFRPERLEPAVTGQVTDEQWRSEVAADLADVCGSLQRAEALTGAWSGLAGEVDSAVLTLLNGLRGRVPLVLVSNATTRLEDDLAVLGLADVFDHVINTARVGVAKPDPRVFALAARLAEAVPNRCLFVDDTAANVAAARAAGMSGLHYQSPEQLGVALAPLTTQSRPVQEGSPD